MAANRSKTDPTGFSAEKLKQLGQRLQQLRKAKGYDSYETFANDHNIHRAQYGRYEKGQDLQFSSLVRLVDSFDMTLAEFFSEGFK